MTMKLSVEDREVAAALAVHAHVKRMGAADSPEDAIDELMMVMGAAAAGLWAVGGKQAMLDGIDNMRARALADTGLPEGAPDPGPQSTPLQ